MKTYKAMYIYKTTNTINGKLYIGQHKTNFNRTGRYIGSGTLLTKAIKKYGKANFTCEILCYADNIDTLNTLEIFWIKELNTLSPNGYNLSPGGNQFQEKDLDIEVKIHRVLKLRQAKPLICTNTGVIYRTMAEAARAIGVTYKRMNCHLNNPNRAFKLTKQKLIFKFLEGQDLEDFYKQYE